MCIPSGLSDYVMSLHCLISRDHILDYTCKNVSDMWLTICCWRTIVECVCWQILCLFNTLLKYLIFFPEVQYLLLSVHEFQFSRNLVVHVVFPFLINIKKPFVVIRTKGFEFVIPPITYILTYALPLTQEIRQSLLEQISFGLQLQSDIPKVSTVTGLAPPPARC